MIETKRVIAMQTIKTWFIASCVFIALDMLWLGKLMSGKYTEKLGFLAELIDGRIQFNLLIGVLAQLVIVSGIVFVLFKSLDTQSQVLDSALTGAIVGFVIYATYDLTNLSYVKGWPLDITVIDILWGTFQGAVTGLVVWFLSFKSI